MQKEVSELEKRLLLRHNYVGKIADTLKKPFIEQREVYSIVKGFFSELLNITYEFTYEELSRELTKIFIKPATKKEIDDFLIDLSDSEYVADLLISQEEVRGLLDRFVDIIKRVIHEEDVEMVKDSFFGKIFGQKKNASSFGNETFTSSSKTSNTVLTSDYNSTPSVPSLNLPPQIDTIQVQKENSLLKQSMFKNVNDIDEEMDDLPPIMEPTPLNTNMASNFSPLMIEDNSPEMLKVYELMEEAYIQMSSKNMDSAKQKYLEALDMYHKLNKEEKKSLYAGLFELYKTLTSR